MYKTGDKVVHQLEGACYIVDIADMPSNKKSKKYYILESILDKKTRIYVSMQNTDRIRSAVTQKQLQEFEDIANSQDADWIDDPMRRGKAYLKVIQEFDFLEGLLMIKNLLTRQATNSLGANDKKLLVTAQKLIFSEISIVLNKEYNLVAEKINEFYQSSALSVETVC